VAQLVSNAGAAAVAPYACAAPPCLRSIHHQTLCRQCFRCSSASHPAHAAGGSGLFGPAAGAVGRTYLRRAGRSCNGGLPSRANAAVFTCCREYRVHHCTRFTELHCYAARRVRAALTQAERRQRSDTRSTHAASASGTAGLCRAAGGTSSAHAAVCCSRLPAHHLGCGKDEAALRAAASSGVHQGASRAGPPLCVHDCVHCATSQNLRG
jgi:hypothetical protein